jgi:hypothetical protein
MKLPGVTAFDPFFLLSFLKDALCRAIAPLNFVRLLDDWLI